MLAADVPGRENSLTLERERSVGDSSLGSLYIRSGDEMKLTCYLSVSELVDI